MESKWMGGVQSGEKWAYKATEPLAMNDTVTGISEGEYHMNSRPLSLETHLRQPIQYILYLGIPLHQSC